MRFPIRKQYDAMDCGPTCLQMIAEYYGQYYSLQTLREKSYLVSTELINCHGSKAVDSILCNGICP